MPASLLPHHLYSVFHLHNLNRGKFPATLHTGISLPVSMVSSTGQDRTWLGGGGGTDGWTDKQMNRTHATFLPLRDLVFPGFDANENETLAPSSQWWLLLARRQARNAFAWTAGRTDAAAPPFASGAVRAHTLRRFHRRAHARAFAWRHTTWQRAILLAVWGSLSTAPPPLLSSPTLTVILVSNGLRIYALLFLLSSPSQASVARRAAL